MSAIEVDTPVEKFRILYNLPKEINLVICIGPRGGAKTYEVSKFGAFSSTIRKKRIVVVRDEKEKIRDSILNEIFIRYDSANEYGHFDGLFDKIETGIRDLTTGEMMVFTQGFRASSKEKKANLKGISNVDIAIVEEGEDIRDRKKFFTFTDSIRKEGYLIILILNVPDINHWVIETFFETELVTDTEYQQLIQDAKQSFFRIKPKQIPGFVCIQTSHEDNPNLAESKRREYESYGDPKSERYDPYHYLTAIKGFASYGRVGQILTKVKPISLKDYLDLPYREIYGLDFGTARPAGLVGVKLHHNTSWARQLNYLPKDTLPIGKMLCDLKFTNKDLVIADSANPLDIGKIRNGWDKKELTPEDIEKYPQLLKGFFILGAIKGPGSVEAGLRLMKGMDLYAVRESEDLWNEIRKYINAVDKNEKPIDEPVDDFNHLIDPWRYVITGRGKLF